MILRRYYMPTTLAMSVFLVSGQLLAEENAGAGKQKVRTIITTDGEADDQCLLVRYFLYANEFELEGIVSSSSIFHYSDQGEGRFKGKDSNQTIIDAYAQVYENLSQHAEGYPTPEYLTERSFEGNVISPGEMATDTEGSLFIKDVILDEREDRLLLQAWCGVNTHSVVLRSIEDEYKDTDQWEDIYTKVQSSCTVPEDANFTNTIHIIAEATDNNEEYPITRYRRVIVTVAAPEAE